MARIAAKATKGKGKRWIKGQSSSSNPTTTKYRNKALQMQFSTDGTTTIDNNNSSNNSKNKLKLTKDLLDKYDAMQQQKQRQQQQLLLQQESGGNLGGIDDWLNQASKENDNDSDSDKNHQNDDTVSVGNVSVASIWSNCTNVTFDKFLNGFDPKSKIHKSMLTVLATIREAIESQNGSETETEYFAGLMMALNCVQSEDKLTATVSLIQMVLRRVPSSVLKLKFAETSRVFLKILSENTQSSNPNGYLLKSVISSLGILLQNQELAVWELNSTQRIFETLLSLVLNPKPRVRKAASFTVISIVRNISGGGQNGQNTRPGTEIARRLTAEFCIRKLKEYFTTTIDDHLNILLYILSLLSDTMRHSPSVGHTKQLCDSILTHMKLGNVLVVTGALQTFYSFFVRKPDLAVISPELNAQLMNFLYDYQPNINDEQPLNAWFTTLKEGLLCLARLDPGLAHLHLPKFIQTSIFCLQSDSVQVHCCVCNSIKVIFSLVINQPQSEPEVSDELLAKIYTELENALKYKYSHAWLNVIPMLSEMLSDKTAARNPIGSIMVRLSILHESNDREINDTIDGFFAKAVTFYGPRTVLERCPIKWKTIESLAPIDDASNDYEEFRGEFTNAWLLPILRDHIGDRSELALFLDHFIPLADEISKRSATCQKLATKLKHFLSDLMETDGEFNSYFHGHESCMVASKELKRCCHAVWSLLPSFCRRPVDIPLVFTKIAKRFGDMLYDKELCSYSLAALRNLVKCSENQDDIRKVVGRFAKNYIPILFNIYTNENENNQIDIGLRLPVFYLVQQFLPLLFVESSNRKFFQTFYNQINGRLEESGCTEFRRNALLDLIRAFLGSPEGFKLEDIEKLYGKLIKPLIEDENRSTTEQKNGFKMFEEIVQSSSEACVQFIRGTILEQMKFLLSFYGGGNSSKSKCSRSPSTKSFALRSLRRLVEHYFLDPNKHETELSQNDWEQFFEKLLPIIFDNLLLKSSKAQKSAHDTLVVLAEAFEKVSQPAEFKLVSLIIDPLRQQMSEISIQERLSRSMAINYLYIEKYHHPMVPKDIECNIADVILAQLSSPSNDTPLTRPILDVCFEFIRNFFNFATPDLLNSYLELVTCNITNLPEQHRLKYRMKIRSLLIKLIRKYGFDFISSMIPEDYRKVLKNIRKFEERKKKKQLEENGGNDDNGSESGIESDTKSRRSIKSKKCHDFSDDDEAEVERFVDENWSNDEKDDDEEDGDNQGGNFRTKSKFDIMSRISSKSSKNYIREDVNSDPIDLLSTAANRNVFSRIPKKFKLEAQQGGGANPEEASGKEEKKFPVNQDGRLVITELLDQIEGTEGPRAPKRSLKDNSDSDSDGGDDNRTVRSGKSAYQPGGRGIHRAVSVSGQSRTSQARSTTSRKSKRGNNNKNEPSINRGEAYSSKTATGDMKRRGMPDPYAYYPLNPMQLNRRKAMKFKGEFNSMVKGAKKGTAAGLHLRNKRRKTSK